VAYSPALEAKTLLVSENYLSKRSEIGYPCAVSTSKNGQLRKVDMNGTLKGKIATFNMLSSKDNSKKILLPETIVWQW